VSATEVQLLSFVGSTSRGVLLAGGKGSKPGSLDLQKLGAVPPSFLSAGELVYQ